jgi:hypothetical protein
VPLANVKPLRQVEQLVAVLQTSQFATEHVSLQTVFTEVRA